MCEAVISSWMYTFLCLCDTKEMFLSCSNEYYIIFSYGVDRVCQQLKSHCHFSSQLLSSGEFNTRKAPTPVVSLIMCNHFKETTTEKLSKIIYFPKCKNLSKVYL